MTLTSNALTIQPGIPLQINRFWLMTLTSNVLTKGRRDKSMSEYNARHIIEALRSGVPSRTVGEYFSEARPGMMKKISSSMEKVRETGRSSGMIIKGRYGEGKTHLLNTVFGMAFDSNMVVSLVSLGKETPIDKLHLLYPKLMANTYLPGAAQPGFRPKLEELTQGSSVSSELLGYTAQELETDKLYYLLKAFLGTSDDEERLAFLADMEGDFTNVSLIKKSFKRVTGNTAKFNRSFSKTKHSMDYFCFASHLFRALGYNGWVILFDETELIGRLGKKTRMKSYVNMNSFLQPSGKLENVFSLFAMSASYSEDVIDKRNEIAGAEETFQEDPDSKKAALSVLNAILNAPELAPLTKAETVQVLLSIQKLHGEAYHWAPDVSEDTLLEAAGAAGHLLRSKIRAAIEFLDQLYQYGEAGSVKITELGKESLDEEVPEVEFNKF